MSVCIPVPSFSLSNRSKLNEVYRLDLSHWCTGSECLLRQWIWVKIAYVNDIYWCTQHNGMLYNALAFASAKLQEAIVYEPAQYNTALSNASSNPQTQHWGNFLCKGRSLCGEREGVTWIPLSSQLVSLDNLHVLLHGEEVSSAEGAAPTNRPF